MILLCDEFGFIAKLFDENEVMIRTLCEVKLLSTKNNILLTVNTSKFTHKATKKINK
jgi:hypothetical protein